MTELEKQEADKESKRELSEKLGSLLEYLLSDKDNDTEETNYEE